MKKQTIIIGTIVILSLLAVFNYVSGVFPESHSQSIEENNVTLTQEVNLVESRYETSMTEDGRHTYPIMRPDSKSMIRWIEQYNNAPKAIIDKELETRIKGTLGGDNFSLLSHLEYVPSERNQGHCGNCWVWAGTGCLGIALDIQENIKNRLSIQYLNSNFNDGNGDWACCGGLPEDFIEFYNNTKKIIPWSNTNASWQDGDMGCGGDTMVPADTISLVPDYPIDYIADETITTHNVSNGTAIDNIKNILNQNKAIWFSFYLPSSADWDKFFRFWDYQGENVTWNPDYSCGDMWDSGGGHAVLCVGYNDEDPNNKYWIMLNSWGAPTNRHNGLFHLDMDMDYDCYFYKPYPVRYYSFYWQTVNVSFNIEIPEIVTNMSTNVGETNVTLSGTLLNNGSCDTTCYFLWNTTNNFGSPMGNESVDIIVDGASFSHNISNLSEGQMYFFKAIANNSNGWNTRSNIESFLTKPAPLISFNADMLNSSEIVLTWTNGEGGDGAYIEYAIGSQPDPWNPGNGTPVDTDGYITSPFNHTSLSPNTRYYYKAWAYAEDEGWKSNGSTTTPFGDNPQVQYNKTNALPIITGESPSDNSIDIDNMQPTVSVTIEDVDRDNINWTICVINMSQNSSTDDKNGSKSANLDIPLPYNTNVIWHVNVTDGHDWTNATYNFTVRNRYNPSIPTSFISTAYNRTQINLTWSKGTNADRTYIEWNTVPSWDRGSGTELYNDTGTNYRHTNLSFGTIYCYQSWSWNDTDSCWSTTSSSDSNTTDSNTAPSFGVSTPANGSSNQDSAFVWNISITDTDSDMFNWTIECSNGDSSNANDDSNGIKQLSINDLCFNTVYTIWVNATDGYNWTREWFTFVTRAPPGAPIGFNAVTKNSTQIDLSWTKGVKTDYTRIQRKTGSYPTSISDGNNVYNSTGASCYDKSLSEGVTYYYCAWSWNQTDNVWSASNSNVSNTTNNIPTVTNEGPSSDSASVDLTPTLNITVNDLDGDRMTLTWYSNSSGSWQLFGTNTSCINSTYHQINSNFSNTSTTYYWNVTVNDGLSTNISVTYCFTTRDRYIPESPNNFTASADGQSRIVLTWMNGVKTDKTYIRYKSGETSPVNRTDGTELGNYTGEGTHVASLDPGTKYSFKAWSWNDTDNCWSISASNSSATTETGKKKNPSVPPSLPSEESSNKVNSTKGKIEKLYNITLEENFSAVDTDGNGFVDTFIDPNGILKAERLTSINGNISFLVSVHGRLDELFIWDVKTDGILEVTYSLGTVVGALVDVQNDSVIVTVSIVKSNWTYMEIKDQYQYLPNLTVKTPDGRNIPADKIWRENGTIYMLDDPSIEYQLIYNYVILAPTFNPANKTIFDISNPIITITYNENVIVTKVTLNNKLINLSTADNKTFIYVPIANMANGFYILNITAQDAGNNSRDDSIVFTINVEKSIESQDAVSEGGFSWVELFAIIVVVIIPMVIFLFKFLVSNQEK